MAKFLKCRYKYCKHESREIPREDAILSGKSTFYHKDCFEEIENKKKIVDLFHEKINPNSPFPQIQRTITDIIHNKGISAEFLLFGLQYYINNKIPLNYPPGLYYVVANKDVKKAFNKSKLKNDYKFEVTGDVGTEFKYEPHKKSLDNFMEG